MKAYKVELLIIDFDELGEEQLKNEILSANYANDCVSPVVMRMQEREIGEWDEAHPLNKRLTRAAEYERLFGSGNTD